ncbi:MAG: hypothetical protein LBB39_02735 [Mycoplasmataceae bacterium]|jgi:hypothetical protein|nr:hypothetical protein [Mycoplasmataceae bacterium]
MNYLIQVNENERAEHLAKFQNDLILTTSSKFYSGVKILELLNEYKKTRIPQNRESLQKLGELVSVCENLNKSLVRTPLDTEMSEIDKIHEIEKIGLTNMLESQNQIASINRMLRDQITSESDDNSTNAVLLSKLIINNNFLIRKFNTEYNPEILSIHGEKLSQITLSNPEISCIYIDEKQSVTKNPDLDHATSLIKTGIRNQTRSIIENHRRTQETGELDEMALQFVEHESETLVTYQPTASLDEQQYDRHSVLLTRLFIPS